VNALRVLLTYTEAARAELDAKDPSTTLIAVPDESGQVEEKLFGECTVEELRKALQRLRRPTSSAPLPAEAQARAEQCHAVWTGYFPKNAGVRVELRNRGGKAVVSLKHIPLEQLEALTALLGGQLRSLQAA
jgi:hypothetical protein